MISILVAGECEPCGERAMSEEGFICSRCNALQEGILREVAAKSECARLMLDEMKRAAEATNQLDLMEHSFLAQRAQADERIHHVRYLRFKEALAARETAFTEKLEAERGAA